MRLSSRLSDKSKNTGEIESFIDLERYTVSPEEESEDLQLISAGDFIEIQIGTIMQPFYSTVNCSVWIMWKAIHPAKIAIIVYRLGFWLVLMIFLHLSPMSM